MNPEDLFPYSQEPATGPYPELGKFPQKQELVKTNCSSRYCK
jgi:hypothetical protein